MTEFWAAIIGAVVGAVVGGLISLGLQILGARAAEGERNEDRVQLQRALAHAILFKMMRMYTNLWGFHTHIEECFTRMAQHGPDFEPWQAVLSIANHPKHVDFATEEMAMLLSMKDDNLFNDVASLDTSHNSLVDLFRLVSEKRESFMANLPAQMDGLSGQVMIPLEQMPFLRPKMVELNQLLVDIKGRAATDFHRCDQNLTKLAALFKSKLDLSYTITKKTA